ncbi:glycosyltransferase family 39 protein [bacterium]|nr:glycosyltransferase family 39 protein [bacterium]
MRLSGSLSERAILMLVWGVALIALWGSIHINIAYLDKIPHVQDSVNYLFQAQLFGMGKTYIEVPSNVKSFSSEHIIVQNGRWYCHYPFLIPLLFMFGLKLGLTWLINPLFAMASVLLIYQIGRENYSSITGLWAAIFLTSSPFFMVMSASFMSHPTALFLTSLCLLLFLRLLKKPTLQKSVLLGSVIGLLFNTRPLTAFAIGLTIFSFHLRNRNIFPKKQFKKHIALLIAFSLIGVAVFFAYSSHLSGKTLQFATHTKVSETHGPSKVKLINRFVNSFAAAGVAKQGHSPERGIGCVKALMELYHTYSLNWPGWLNLSFFLIPLIPWRRKETDKFLYWTFFSIPLLYTLYWRSAIMLGPRYIYEILPMTVLLSARGMDICLESADWLHSHSFMKNWNTRKTAKVSAAIALYCFAGWLIFTNINQFFIKSSFSLKKYPPVSLVPMKLTTMKNFNAVRRTVPTKIEEMDIHNAVVFIKDHRWQGFGSVSSFNSPALDTDIVYAKDLGKDKNKKVLEMFPDKDAYWTKYPSVSLHRYLWDPEENKFKKEKL